MRKKENSHSSETHGEPSANPALNSPYESVVSQVVSKIRNEPFLFVIGVAALLVGLAILATQIGPSELRLIVIVIGFLAFLVIMGYYIREVVSAGIALRSTPRVPKPPPPVFKESVEFTELKTLEEKKKYLIHPFQERIRSGTLALSEEQRHDCAASLWDFDRIILYLQEENSTRISFDDRFHHVRQEWEELYAAEGRRSLIPLHYAVRSSLAFLQRHAVPVRAANESVHLYRKILEYLKARPEIDQGDQIKDNLTLAIAIVEEQPKE